MLGATPHEFESRILRQCLTGHDSKGPTLRGGALKTASPRGVLLTILRPCAGIILGGSAAGIVGALAVAPLLSSLLHGVDPSDRSMLAAAPAMLTIVGILAAVLASARVLRVAPAETLRSE